MTTQNYTKGEAKHGIDDNWLVCDECGEWHDPAEGIVCKHCGNCVDVEWADKKVTAQAARIAELEKALRNICDNFDKTTYANIKSKVLDARALLGEV